MASGPEWSSRRRRPPRSRGRSMPSVSAFRRERPRRAHPDRHTQIGLRGGADRTECLHQPEIDHEGQRGGRTPQERAAPAASSSTARASTAGRPRGSTGNEDRRAAHQRARRRRHRIEALEAAAEDGAAGVADGRDHRRDLGRELLAEASQACTPTIRQMPAIPATTPNSFRASPAHGRVMASVRKNAKIGEVELRIVAAPRRASARPRRSGSRGSRC